MEKDKENLSSAEARKMQLQELRRIIEFAYNNVKYYRDVFEKLDLKPQDVREIQDLEKLPILTKKIIKENFGALTPTKISSGKYITSTTGGSTGEPLKFRISKDDYMLMNVLLYICWGYAGYDMGDRMFVLGGSSLFPSSRSTIKEKMTDYALNFRSYSSFDLTNDMLNRIFLDINKYKPKFIRGYPSAIYLLAKAIENENLKLPSKPRAIFTTAEVLYPNQRMVIENVFGCRVFDNYGLNDGGVSACECEMHDGYHIDMSRAVMEIVDENGEQLGPNEEGNILATSLHNYALPFIRYDTGDLGILSDKKCSCGRNLPLLKCIIGRTTDYLKFHNGTVVSTPVLTILFGKFDIIQYQIIQKTLDTIVINIIKGENFSNEDEKKIRETFYQHVGKINISFNYVDRIEPKKGGKLKFIINEVEDVHYE